MKKLLLLFCLALSFTARAQKEKVLAYIDSYKELAMTEMQRTGVPAAITLAQGILESQWGESSLAKTSNNHFGIKCKTEWTGAKTYHDDDEKGECFRVYPSAEDSYHDHSDFLKARPHYAFLFKLDPTDYEGWAQGLKKAGYATSPTYPQRLLKLINDYQLQQYSLTALARSQAPVNESYSQSKPAIVNPAPVITPVAEQPVVAVTQETVQPEPSTAAVSTNTNSLPAAPVAVNRKTNYPSGIFIINNTRVIYATEGTSLLSLANQYDIPLSNLIAYNDLSSMDVLDTDRLMFIERKPKKGAVDLHVVTEGETLHSICQQEAIRLDSLLEYNRLGRSSNVNAGEKIYLRPATAAPTVNTIPHSPK